MPDTEEINHIGYGPFTDIRTKCIYDPRPPERLIETLSSDRQGLLDME